MRFTAIICAVLPLAACATITRGTTETVTFHSDPPGAVARTSTGMVCESTPCSFELPRKGDFAVLFSKPGYKDRELSVVAQTPFDGGAALAGNVLAGGLVGIVLDSSNGATLSHAPNPVFAALEPEEPPPARLSEETPARRHVSVVARSAPNPAAPRPTAEARRE
jgi:hypothetical protein